MVCGVKLRLFQFALGVLFAGLLLWVLVMLWWISRLWFGFLRWGVVGVCFILVVGLCLLLAADRLWFRML